MDVEGRIQAVEFIGNFIDLWRAIAVGYREHKNNSVADAFDSCAEMLDIKIEEFACSK